MFRHFTANTANELWCQAALALNTPDITPSSSRCGPIKEIIHATFEIRCPTQRWIGSRTPALNLPFALAEVVWILAGRNDAAFLNWFNSRLPSYAGDGATYHGAYGYRLIHQFGIDQLQTAYMALKSNPQTRQIALSYWHPASDLPKKDGTPKSPDVPCNITSLIKVRNSRLDWLQIMRSNDLMLGLPYNIVQFTFLQELMAAWVGVEMGIYHQVSDSLHLYEDSWAKDLIADKEPNSQPANTDRFYDSYESTQLAVKALEKLIEIIITTPEEEPDLEFAEILNEFGHSAPWKNMAIVFIAESFRKRLDLDACEDVMSNCTNPCYKHMMANWVQRFKA